MTLIILSHIYLYGYTSFIYVKDFIFTLEENVSRTCLLNKISVYFTCYLICEDEENADF